MLSISRDGPMNIITIVLMAVVLLLACIGRVEAGEPGQLNLIVGGYSWHSEQRHGPQDWNETHNNIGLEYLAQAGDDTNWYISGQVQRFKNSYDVYSNYVGVGATYMYTLTSDMQARIGVTAGPISGYTQTSIAAFPVIELWHGRVGLAVTGIPAGLTPERDGQSPGVVFVQAKIKLSQ